MRQSSITSNVFRRSGKLANAESHDSCQLLLDGSWGVTCVGNSFVSGRYHGDKGQFSPSYGIVYSRLEDCVITNGVLHDGAMRQLILDLGNNQEGLVVRGNPSRLFVPRA